MRATFCPVTTLQLRPVEVESAVEQLIERLLVRRFRADYGSADSADYAGREAAAREAASSAVRQGLPRLEPNDVVTADGTVVGRLWWQRSHDELGVADLVLDNLVLDNLALPPTLLPTLLPSLLPAVRETVLAEAAAAGVERLTVAVPAGDVTLTALVAEGGFELSSTQMRLDLTTGDPDNTELAARVRLEPLPQADYDAWCDWQVAGYADARHQAGESLSTAQTIAVQQLGEMLPEGLATPGHHIFVVRDSGSGERVGVLWLSSERRVAYVYDIEIDEAQRRKGYGAATMHAAAQWARARNAPALGLNVFGYNTGARALYDSLGYRVVEDFYGLRLGARD